MNCSVTCGFISCLLDMTVLQTIGNRGDATKNGNKIQPYRRINSLGIIYYFGTSGTLFFKIFIPQYFIFFSLLLKNIVNFHYAKADKINSSTA
jgi:hypothetical protein